MQWWHQQSNEQVGGGYTNMWKKVAKRRKGKAMQANGGITSNVLVVACWCWLGVLKIVWEDCPMWPRVWCRVVAQRRNSMAWHGGIVWQSRTVWHQLAWRGKYTPYLART